MRGDLINLDPTSEQHFASLAAVIAAELQARLAVGDAVDTPERILAVAELVADGVLDVFVVRARTGETPRYRWET